MPVTAAELQRLSALLDEAIDLDSDARERWLGALAAADADLAPTLRRLLATPASRRTDDILDRGPVLAPPAQAELSTFAAGDRVGPYRLLRGLGEGGMGEVWLAERADGTLQRPVALKLPMLAARRAVLVQRFARERDILAGLSHPNIARLYDAGVADDGQPFLALEYVDGETIIRFADARRLGTHERVALLQQVMDAVQHAHAHLVIHRDIKPTNVLVTAAGQAMLLDFGIAKLLHDADATADETDLTRLGGRALTLDYAAPEQVAATPVSTATDVYAIGVLAYELLTGVRPFTGPRHEVENAILTRDPPRPRGLDADLATILLKALKKAPAERYPTPNAFSDDLARWRRGEPVRAQPDRVWYRARKFVVRHRIGVATTAAVAVLVLGAAAVAVRQAQIARTEAATANAVQDFLQSIFRANSADQDDPLTARKRTAKELLDEGAARIATALDEAPQAKLRVLRTLAAMYTDLADLERIVVMFDRQIELLPRVGAGGVTEVEVRAGRASALMDLQRYGDARAELDRIAALLGRGVDPEPAVRAAVHVAESIFFTHSGIAHMPERALDEADRAIALLRGQAPGRPLVDALHQRSVALGMLGRARESAASLTEAVAIVRSDPRANRGPEVELLWELADARAELGEASEADRVFREVFDVLGRRHGAAGTLVFWSHVEYIRFLARESRLHDAAEQTDRAVSLVRAWAPSSDRDVARIGLLRYPAHVLLRLGRLAEAEAIVAEAEAVAIDAQQDSEGVWRRLHRRGWLETERGDFAAAARALDAAEALVTTRGLTAHPFIYAHRAAQVRLAIARGDATRAGAWLNDWPPGGLDVTPDGVEPVRAALHAEARLAAGDAAGARRAAEAALASLARDPRRARHADAELDLHEARGRAALAAGDVATAVEALREAERSASTLLDEGRSPRLARVRAALGLALLASGDRPAASALAASAAVIASRHERLDPQVIGPLRQLQRALR